MQRLNLFRLAAKRTPDDIQRQRIITRCYVFFFASANSFSQNDLYRIDETTHLLVSGSIIVLVALTSTATQTVTVVVSKPTLTAYRELQNLHAGTLECACSNSIMLYDTFITLSSTFHQICSSDLTSDEWVSRMLAAYRGIGGDNFWDFMSGHYFKALSSFCELAHDTTNRNINNFLAQAFATTYVLSKSDFDIQLNATINQFIESVVTSFSLFIDTIRLLIQADQPIRGDKLIVVSNSDVNIYEGTSQPSTPVGLLSL